MIPVPRAHLYVSAVSHPGLRGKVNEDRFGVSAYRVEDAQQTPSVLAVLADGIGGHRAGEVAAELAVETVSRIVAESDASDPLGTLQQAIVHTSRTINAHAQTDPNLAGMGSTIACAWIIGPRLYIAAVGDSRIYLARNHSLAQLTTDHTWVQEAIEEGKLSPEQARNHPNAHVIRRYLGSPNDVIPDMRLRLHPGENDRHAQANQGVNLLPGDMILLCSDGLTDLVSDAEILAALETRKLQSALDELALLAIRRGGYDNITVVALRMPVLEKATIPLGQRRQRLRLSIAGLFAGLLLAALLLAASVWGTLERFRTDPAVSAQPAPATAALSTPLPVATLSLSATATQSTQDTSPAPTTTPPALATLTPWPTNTRLPP